MNKIITEEQNKGNAIPDLETKKFTDRVRKLADYDFRINPDFLRKQAPFLAYVFFWVMLFIYSSHRAEKLIRETDKLNKEVKDLRSEYISVSSELMRASKQSAVAKKLEKTGVKELKTPPQKITYSGN
jgi:cell division protein FtsL